MGRAVRIGALALLAALKCSFTERQARGDVLVVACASAESRQVAEVYARRRGIPRECLLNLPVPLGEEVDYETYVSRIERPIRSLVEQRSGIRYVVLCYGVPYRIKATRRATAVEDALMRSGRYEDYVKSLDWASVDSELASLRFRLADRRGWVRNPLYWGGPDADLVLRVTRLDGPSADAAIALVERAQLAEQRRIPRTAMVDLNPPLRGSAGYQARNDRMSGTATWLEHMGFTVRRELTPATERRISHWGRPALYFGWYAEDPVQEAAAGDDFPCGAIAIHLHSYSASTIRSRAANWVGPLVDHGVTGTVGAVYEPMTDAFPVTDRLAMLLLSGVEFGDAMYRALPYLSWVMVVVGDPLFRPRYEPRRDPQ